MLQLMHSWIRFIKSRFIGVSIILCMCFSGCISAGSFSSFSAEESTPGSYSGSSAEESIPAQNIFPDWDYNEDKAQIFSQRRAAVTENGYYFEAGHILYYYDIEEETAFPLCTKESCLHQDKHCNAYVTEYSPENGKIIVTCDHYMIIPHDRQLYMFSRDQNGDLYLDEYKANFTEKKKLACLTGYTKTPRIMAMGIESMLEHGGYYYYLVAEYDDGKVSKSEYDARFTLCRIKLEKDAVPEELYSFNYILDYSVTLLDASGAHIFALDDDIYCVASSYYRAFSKDNTIQQRVIRYNEKDGAELIWEYTGDDYKGLLNAAVPPPASMYNAFLQENGDLVYVSAYPVTGKGGLYSVNLISGEGRALYQCPHKYIAAVSSDGNYYYIIEVDDGETFLVAVDRDGTEVRRHQFEFTEAYQEQIENRGIRKEECVSGGILFMMTDGRYIMIWAGDSTGDGGVYQNLSTDKLLSREAWDDGACTGVGLILTEDFINGKDVEIRQIY